MRTALGVTKSTKELVDEFIRMINFKIPYDDLIRIAIKRLIADYKKQGIVILSQETEEEEEEKISS